MGDARETGDTIQTGELGGVSQVMGELGVPGIVAGELGEEAVSTGELGEEAVSTGEQETHSDRNIEADWEKSGKGRRC
ncbi:hypothetical protein D4764_09G0010370 [Takifugu flavidus]|uniref:Uncharacterized protein n=1 Tax=Takifugu flavidus TaxID=433684 RepID=A0A5C6MRI7_9TELE|nr:hypothetical protein D4764_09G0010370 [Takifugu flavidus]